MARKAFTEHPEFINASNFANVALLDAAASMGLEASDLHSLEAATNRLADDLTRLLLRAYDAKQAKK